MIQATRNRLVEGSELDITVLVITELSKFDTAKSFIEKTLSTLQNCPAYLNVNATR